MKGGKLIPNFGATAFQFPPQFCRDALISQVQEARKVNQISETQKQREESQARVAENDRIEKIFLSKRVNFETVFTEDICIAIFSQIPQVSLSSTLAILDQVCRLFRHVIEKNGFLVQLDYQCFHSKLTWKEDILGLGLALEYHQIKADVCQVDLYYPGCFYSTDIQRFEHSKLIKGFF